MDIREKLLLLGGKKKGGLTFLFRDDFTIEEAAPMVTPHTCAPGPGTFVITNECYTSGGNLVITSSGAYLGVGSGETFPATAGLALMVQPAAYTGASQYGFATKNSGQFSGAGVLTSAQNFSAYNNLMNGSIQSLVNGMTANQWSAIIRRSNGGAFLVNGNVLNWVDATVNTNALYAFASNTQAGNSQAFQNFRVCELGAPWTDDYGIATNRVETAGAGETTTATADAHVEFTWTATTGASLDLMVRRTDDDNCWIVRCDQTGSTIKLIQKQTGTETERSSAAMTWVDATAYRIVAAMQGSNIVAWVNSGNRKNVYTSATFNATATGVKVSAAGANLITWPVYLTGTALAELAKFQG